MYGVICVSSKIFFPGGDDVLWLCLWIFIFLASWERNLCEFVQDHILLNHIQLRTRRDPATVHLYILMRVEDPAWA